jgi:hypothetical protein
VRVYTYLQRLGKEGVRRMSAMSAAMLATLDS